MGIDAKMFVRCQRAIDKSEVLKVAVRAYRMFGEKLWVDPPNRHCLQVVDRYWQDGPEIRPGEGETIINVSLWSRYYGPGYERGDAVSIIAIAEFLEFAFSPCEVWYGGDSSGVVASLFDKEARDALREHFHSEETDAYFHYFDKDRDLHCDFCGVDAIRNGWGGNYGNWWCNGCGTRVTMRDGKYKHGPARMRNIDKDGNDGLPGFMTMKGQRK